MHEILPKLIKTNEKKGHFGKMSLLCIYNRIVEPLLHSHTDPRESKKMLARDSDPQLFEHLLSSVDNISDTDNDLLRFEDIVVPFNISRKIGNDNNASIQLRYFILNMSRHMLEETSQCLDNLILYTEERYSVVEKCKREVLMYKHKSKYFTSGAAPIDAFRDSDDEESVVENVGSKSTNVNKEIEEVSHGKDNEEDKELVETNASKMKPLGDKSEQSQPLLKSNYIFIRIKNDSGKIVKAIRCELNKEKTLEQAVEDYAKDAKSVHIDDDLFAWNEIKQFQVYDLPVLCGDRKKFTFTFVRRRGRESL